MTKVEAPMLAEVRNNAVAPGRAEEVHSISMCRLTAGDGSFGIDTRAIREVLGVRRVDRVPLAPPFIGGILPYRGEVLTAVSLRALLGLPPRERGSYVLVLDGDASEERFALLVDGVGGVETVDARQMSPNPSTLDEASKALFRGSFSVGGALMVQLQSESLRPMQLRRMEGLHDAALARTGVSGVGQLGKREGKTRCEH